MQIQDYELLLFFINYLPLYNIQYITVTRFLPVLVDLSKIDAQSSLYKQND